MKGTMKTKSFNPQITRRIQRVYSEWEKRFVPIRFAGRCVVCHRTTYQTQEESGNWMDPDPRGMIGDKHSGASLEARDYSLTGEDVPVCWSCRDNAVNYRKALTIAKATWRNI